MAKDKQAPGAEAGDRLQKVLARAGVGSRRQMEERIREGRVTVNGQVAKLGQKVDLDRDAVKVDGKRVAPPSSIHKYVLLNKPPHHVSTLHDPEGRPTIIDLIPARLRTGLVPVGRLDYDSEGLILMTDDGELANRVAHPRYGCTKTYEVKVKGRPSSMSLERFQRGMMLYGKPTAPVTVSPHRISASARESQSNSWWKVVLGEGRTRQIREMFFRLGHPVARLRRVAISQLRDPHLPLGSWRFLSEPEVEELRRKTAKATAPPRRSRRQGVSGRPGRPTLRRPDFEPPADGVNTQDPAKRGPSKGGPSKRGAKDGSSKGGPAKGGPPGRETIEARPKRGPKEGHKRGPKGGAAKRGESTGGPRRVGSNKLGSTKRGPSKGGPSKGGPSKRSPAQRGPSKGPSNRGGSRRGPSGRGGGRR